MVKLIATRIFEDNNADICVSRITFTEFYIALYKKTRAREITDIRLVLQSINDFEIDMQDVWVVQMHDKIYADAQNLLKMYAQGYSLRTLDALQLACAELVAQSGEMRFITADTNQLSIANQMGFVTSLATDKV